MLIIGHRGAAGLAPENSLEALRSGMSAGADILEFDVRLTRDRIPVVIHDRTTLRTHKTRTRISRTTYDELMRATKDAPILTLDELLDEFFGKILLNIEIKSRGAADTVIDVIRRKVKRKSDWDNVIVSSFYGGELSSARKASPEVNLALLHSLNPFLFIAYHRRLNLTAVGFHRLYVDAFALKIARRTGIFTYAYTVNRPATALSLARKGLDAVVTDRPDAIIAALHPHKKGKKSKKKN